jgi:delta-aminolevulinic acid dehydratase/porphobilinogen synthase
MVSSDVCVDEHCVGEHCGIYGRSTLLQCHANAHIHVQIASKQRYLGASQNKGTVSNMNQLLQ